MMLLNIINSKLMEGYYRRNLPTIWADPQPGQNTRSP